MTDLLTQLRDYGHQIESDPMLGAPSPLTVDTEVRPLSKARPSRRWVLAPVAAVVVILTFLPLLLGRSQEDAAVTTIPTPPLQNGWVAFPVGDSGGDHDIYLVGLGEQAFRVAGSDSDGLDQQCPAFSPDGGRLAYGQAEGINEPVSANGALVVVDVSPDGTVSESFRVETEPGSALPCPTWSPDGENIAVVVRTSDAGGDIWIVPADNGSPTVLEGSYASPDPPAYNFESDIEWSPDGTELAVTDQGGISLYSVADREWRTLDGTSGARTLTWSPDGTRIVYEFDFDGSPDEIRMIEVDGTEHHTLVSNYEALHGIGPVWSPNGVQIVYQRVCCGGERHEIVLVTLEGQEVVLPLVEVPGIDGIWWPRRVTWSPDGSQLLVLAWNYTNETGQKALIAVPVDPESDPLMLYRGEVAGQGAADQLGETAADELAFQNWGRRTQSQ